MSSLISVFLSKVLEHREVIKTLIAKKDEVRYAQALKMSLERGFLSPFIGELNSIIILVFTATISCY